VAQLLDASRCDVLFLSDMRISRRKIGRARQLLESAVQREWLLLTDIRQLPYRPMGIGVLVHSSLASQAQQLQVLRPPDAPESEWEEAVSGRIFLLQIKKPFGNVTWWVVGIYQHVANAGNARKRTLLLRCLADIAERAQRENCYLLLIGDANAAPDGGRWHCRPRSSLYASDAEIIEWARKLVLRETPQIKLTPTWKACMRSCSAVLDRALHLPASLQLSSAHALWADRSAVDHALVYVDLPLAQAGIGFAGACRGSERDNRSSRVRADLTKLVVSRDEWCAKVSQRLRELPRGEFAEDPFASLQLASQIADEVAQQIAPRQTDHSNWTGRRRPFAFCGHSKLQREIQWIHAARCIVRAVIHDDPALLHASERHYLWRTRVEKLHGRLRRSVVWNPPELSMPLSAVLGADSRPYLVRWLELALRAIRDRQGIIRSTFERAIDNNLQRLRGRIRANPNSLTAEMLQAALGRAPPKQRVWGLSGLTPIGVEFTLPSAGGSAVLESVRSLPSADQILRVTGVQSSIDVWFRGPRHLGDFLLQWCGSPHASRAVPVRLLNSPKDYTALLPDDMLAMQELYLARQGMATNAQCPACAAVDVQPLVTSAVSQSRGCPWRAVRYFCACCQPVQDRVVTGMEPPCPGPTEVWARGTCHHDPQDTGGE